MKMSVKYVPVLAIAVAGLCLLTEPQCALAGAVGGAVGSRAMIAPNSFVFQDLLFNRGQRARIVLTGDGSTDLDLYVYDQFGNLVASDEDSSDDCVVTWIPRYTGGYRLKLVNRGALFNSYSWMTN